MKKKEYEGENIFKVHKEKKFQETLEEINELK